MIRKYAFNSALTSLRWTFLAAVAIAPISFGSAMAEEPAATAASAINNPSANPSSPVATVNGEKITLEDVKKTIAALPPEARQLQATMITPLVVDQLIEQKAIETAAKKDGLEKKPEVQAAMKAASDTVLQNAYLEKQVAPKISEKTMKAYYQSHYVDQKPEEEVHARHILVDTESEAQNIIKELKGGADFAQLAAKDSKDKGSAGTDGGDLGWFKKGDMLPAFSQAAFSLKKGEISPKPVHTQYGWHVIQVLGTRTAPIPAYNQVQDDIRRNIVRDEVKVVIQKAVADVKVVRYDANGNPLPASSKK
ncbi:peptidylprolyl isomerase [Acetobacteraceae bacterium]|nr:peptidylprolyl isomerase [Acetobacteraceae bacterium]